MRLHLCIAFFLCIGILIVDGCSGPTTCDPDCSGRECGPDPVCGESCGTCQLEETCSLSTGQCGPCVPSCTGKECGPDGCGGTCPPGCGAGETCTLTSGQCQGCMPACAGRECGPDGCGDTCPPGCGAGEICSQDTWQCESCTPDCAGKECGPDGCGDFCPPGCALDMHCNEATWICEICDQAHCEGRECGPNCLGGTCPPGCGAGEICNEMTGQCEGCTPNCTGKDCGPDGCGGICGPGCGTGEWCNNGACTTVGMVWVQIPGGTFMMGSDTGNPNERPVHSVNVPSFEMTKTQTTAAQYSICLVFGPCQYGAAAGECNWDRPGYEDHPINCVEWYEAAEYCQWIGGRLPSEAEWEYAARSGGRNIIYPWGNDPPSCSLANYSGCAQDTQAVCSLPMGNTLQGLCDMAGNVWEWVQDQYNENYTGAPTDGSAWEFGDDTRVVRGGSYADHPGDDSFYLRAAARSSSLPDIGYYDAGFRCAR